MSPIDRYREFLRRQGVPPETAQIIDEASLALGELRCFRLDAAGRELRACVSPAGLVTGTRAATDAWWQLLGAGDASAVAERVAWLESTRDIDRHTRGRQIVAVRATDRPPSASVDPALWRLAPAPTLRTAPETRELVVWLYTIGADEPAERTVRAHPAAPAEITERPAHEAVALGDPITRATAALGGNDSDAIQWALLVIARSNVTAAAPAAAKLLGHSDPRLRSAAASTLGTLAAAASVDALAAAASHETEEIAQIAQIQALGHVATPASARALTVLRAKIHSATIRVEVIHALARVGDAAADTVHAALADAAAHDDDANLRALATTYLKRWKR